MARYRGQLWWAALGAIAAVLSLVWNLWSTPGDASGPRGSGVVVFFSTANGAPDTDVVVVFLDGQQAEPDLNGLVMIPSNRVGQEASVRRRTTRGELCSLVVPPTFSRRLRIIATDQVEGQQYR